MRLLDVLQGKTRVIYTAKAEESVLQAAKKLVSYNIGALAVTDKQEQLVGIISERDILRHVANQQDNLDFTTVHEVMTKKVRTGKLEDLVEDALATMTEQRIRHLPIVSEGKVFAMISIGDLVKAQLDEAKFEVEHLSGYVQGKYPA